MTDPQDKNDQLVVHYVVHDSVVADSNTQFAVTALERDAAGRARVVGEVVDRLKNALSGLSIKLAEGFRCRGDVSDLICHGSEAEFSGQILVGDTFGLLTGGRRSANVGLIF